jgi:Flp pilus assembly protein TadG
MKLHKLFSDRLGRRGIAAVEFALIIPVLLVLFIGTIEVLTLYRTEAKLNAVAINVAQMVAVAQSVDPTTSSNTGTAPTVTSLNDVCNGAIQGLAPFPSAGLKINIASVTLEPSAANANTPGAFDEWEQDYTLKTSSTCQTASGTAILSGTGTTAPIAVATSTSATNPDMLEEPCDNVIIVQASITYPGLTGLIVQSRPTLTQTAYNRWTNASTLTQLLCTKGASGCTLSPTTPHDFCNSTNTATN